MINFIDSLLYRLSDAICSKAIKQIRLVCHTYMYMQKLLCTVSSMYTSVEKYMYSGVKKVETFVNVVAFRKAG